MKSKSIAQFLSRDPGTFDFISELSLTECIDRLRRLSTTEPTADLVLFRIDRQTQRFHLTTRGMRSHLVECQGYLRADENGAVHVTGQVYVNVASLAVVSAVSVGLLVTGVLAAIFLRSILWLFPAILTVVAFVGYWLIRRELSVLDRQTLARSIEHALSRNEL